MIAEFFVANAVLAIFVAILGGMTIYLWTTGGDKSLLDVESVVEAINYQNAQVFDLRPKAEFDQGHIPGAKWQDAAAAATKLPGLAKKKPLVLVCARGTTSTDTARKLRRDGMADILILKGGMLAWQQDGKPVTRK